VGCRPIARLGVVAMTPLADHMEEAERLIEAARESGTTLRALGGVAVQMRCPSAMRPPLGRRPKDLDFASSSKHRTRVIELFRETGYQADEEFNALHGKTRLFFWDEEHSRQADIFLDRVTMCHTLDLKDRLDEHESTLSVSDLLLLKLQVFETNDRDYKDALSLLLDYADGGIDVHYIAALLAGDWGWWRTATMVLERLDRYARELDGFDRANDVHHLIRDLLGAIEREPKSRRWKMRARIGERARWYELPEETVPG
jgi:hypothetical protein